MFDVGFWEITIIGIVALVIVGPERLPGLARTVGLWLGKARRMLSDVKRDIDREIKASELSELGSVKNEIEAAGKEVQKASDSVSRESGANELKDSFKDTFKDVEPAGESIKKHLKDMGSSANKEAGQVKKDGQEGDDQAGVQSDVQTEADSQASPQSSASDKPQSKSGGDATGG